MADSKATDLSSPRVKERVDKVLKQYEINLPPDAEAKKLDWLLSINEAFFQEQLKEVVSIFYILTLYFL